MPLGSLGDFWNGAAFKPSDWSSEGTPIIRIQNLNDPTRSMNRTQRIVDARLRVGSGDLLVSWSATLDAYVWKGEDAWLNQHIFKVIPNVSIVDQKYMLFLLKNEIGNLKKTEHLHGSTMMHINRGPFLAHLVPLPPMHVQKLIAARIEEAFVEIDDGEAALARARTDLGTWRNALLKSAVTGELTADWRATNLTTETGADLLARLLNERRSNGAPAKKTYVAPPGPSDEKGRPTLPGSWVWMTVEQLCEATRPVSYGVLQPGENCPGGVPLVRVMDIMDGKIAINQLKNIDEEIAAQYPRTFLKGGEILLTVVGSIGRTAIVPIELAGSNTARAVAVLAIKYALPEWVELCLRFEPYRLALESISHEVARKTLNLEDVKNFPIPVPPHDEQIELIRLIKSDLQAETELKFATKGLSAGTLALRQSILAAAFRGELVA